MSIFQKIEALFFLVSLVVAARLWAINLRALMWLGVMR